MKSASRRSSTTVPSLRFATTVDQVMKPGRLEVSNQTADNIQELYIPTTVMELRSFLGLRNAFRWFVLNYAWIWLHRFKWPKKTGQKELGPLQNEERKAHDFLKENLISPPLLTSPKQGMFTLDTHTCDHQDGCVLLQKQKDRKDRPTGYWLSTLSEPENSLNTTHREWLVVVWAVLLPRPFLEGMIFNVWTDHHALRFFLNLAYAARKFACWHLRLMEFNFEVIPNTVFKHQAADPVSRLPKSGRDEKDIDYKLPVLLIQQQSRKEKHQLLRSSQDYDDSTDYFEPHSIMTAKADDVELPTIAYSVLARRKDKFCEYMKN